VTACMHRVGVGVADRARRGCASLRPAENEACRAVGSGRLGVVPAADPEGTPATPREGSVTLRGLYRTAREE